MRSNTSVVSATASAAFCYSLHGKRAPQTADGLKHFMFVNCLFNKALYPEYFFLNKTLQTQQLRKTNSPSEN